MENKKIILYVVIIVFILAVGVLALNLNLIKNLTLKSDVNNNSSEHNTDNNVNINTSNENSTDNGVKSYDSDGDGVSKEQAKQRASEEIKGKDYIGLGDPIWNSEEKLWNVPLFNKNNNNQPYGNIFVYVKNGKITKVVSRF
jgi:hypothetical protein